MMPYAGSSEWTGTLLMIVGFFGVLIFGLNTMSEGMERVFGSKLRELLEKNSGRFVPSVFLGFIISAVVQSSASTTGMVLGFVNTGTMPLLQALALIIGANVGTTITVQLLSLNLFYLAPVAILAGILGKLYSESDKVKRICQISMGLGMVFLSMGMLKLFMTQLSSQMGAVGNFNMLYSGHLLDVLFGIFAGFIFSAVLHSSTVTIAMLMTAVFGGVINMHLAFPIIMGANIGSCVNVLISAMGASRETKRAALLHFIFNLTGAVLFGLFLYKPILQWQNFMGSNALRQVANIHLVFNVLTALVMMPLASVFIRWVGRFVPDGKPSAGMSSATRHIDERLLKTPSIAITQVIKEILHMGNTALEAYEMSIRAFKEVDSLYVRETFRLEKTINSMEHAITDFLIKLSNTSSITDKDRKILDGLFSTVNDIERVGDHSENLAELAMERIEKKLYFSDLALEELEGMYSTVRDAYRDALSTMRDNDLVVARKVIEIEKEIDIMEKGLRKQHIKRLNDAQCYPGSGVIFLDIISNLERIGDHASNIAIAVVENNENQ